MKTKKNILYLINSKSNDHSASTLWTKAAKQYSFLPQYPIDITTTDIRSLVMKQKPDIIAIAGGDGTIRSVCSMLTTVKKKPSIAIIPLGFGNALSYCFGVETLEKSMHVLQNQTTICTIDAMRITHPDVTLGLFNIGVGFDAHIIHNRIRNRYIGIFSYFFSGLETIVSHAKSEMIITIDHTTTLRANASSLVIANGPIIGKNYIISPTARFDNGFLDCILFSSNYAYLTNLRLKGFKHPLYSNEGKVYFKAKHIKIQGETFVQVDGDPYVNNGKIEVEILPKEFTFLTNKNTFGFV